MFILILNTATIFNSFTNHFNRISLNQNVNLHKINYDLREAQNGHKAEFWHVTSYLLLFFLENMDTFSIIMKQFIKISTFITQ